MNPCRDLPSVNELVDAVAARRDGGTPRALIVTAARRELDAQRRRLTAADANGATAPTLDALAAEVAARIDREAAPPLRGAINATGIILHTGLGRAPLAPEAVAALRDVASQYAPVELDLDSGDRGRRADIVRGLLCELTGAESATVVNNNAAALVLVLSVLARDREVVVSRGELIEIGGSFRLPDIMQASGAVLHEVGTTNKTRLADYERAIGDRTAALLKVHTSNYRIDGFTAAVSTEELAVLGRRRGVPVIDDIGSGAIIDRTMFGGGEPTARSSIAAGADVVLFSGDKLLGGPQAGLIVGRRPWIERLERHPLMRALRVDKLTLAALGATLQLHRVPAQAAARVPVLAMAGQGLEALRARAEAIAARLRAAGLEVTIGASTAYLGGGSMPSQAIESVALTITLPDGGEARLAARLRGGSPAVMARVHGGAVHLDVRTVLEAQDEALATAVLAATRG